MDHILIKMVGLYCLVKERIRYTVFKMLITANLNITELGLKVIDIIGKIPTPVLVALNYTWKCIQFVLVAACYCVLFSVFLVFEIIEALIE